MLSRNLGFISCALGAGAFLIPSTVSLDNDIAPFEIDAKSQLYQLSCSTCDWQYKDHSLERENDMLAALDVRHNLLLNFSIAEDGRGLMLNDHFIYPFEKMLESGKPMADLYIDQIPATTDAEEIRADDYTRLSLEVTGAGIAEEDAIHGDGKDTLISLNWHLLSLAEQPVDVDSVAIRLLQAETGEYFILSVDSKPVHRPSIVNGPSFGGLPQLDLPSFGKSPETRPYKRPCSMPGPLCAMADFISTSFASGPRRPCPGRKHQFDGEHLPTHIRPHFGRPASPFDRDNGPFGPPFHTRPHGRHGRHHGFFHFISRGILAVLIPVMAGVTVGVVVSVLGLLFGRFLGYMWFTFYRGGRRGYASVAMEENVEKHDDEDLPHYEDAPAYEEVDSKTSS